MAVQLPTTDGTSVHQLRERILRMQEGAPRNPLETHAALADLVQLRTGDSYGVDSASLAMALMAGPSQAGAWCAVVGVADFGVEAAAAMGVDLTRTVLVPDPGEHWVEVIAAMVDVASVVVVRPAVPVSEHVASRIGARLRKRSAVLIALGDWPRCDAWLSLHEPTWSGAGRGDGHLRSRRVVVAVRRGSAPPLHAPMWLPAPDAQVRRCEMAPVAAVEVRDAS